MDWLIRSMSKRRQKIKRSQRRKRNFLARIIRDPLYRPRVVDHKKMKKRLKRNKKAEIMENIVDNDYQY